MGFMYTNRIHLVYLWYTFLHEKIHSVYNMYTSGFILKAVNWTIIHLRFRGGLIQQYNQLFPVFEGYRDNASGTRKQSKLQLKNSRVLGGRPSEASTSFFRRLRDHKTCSTSYYSKLFHSLHVNTVTY